ncbi:MAG: DNA polymerase III subunit gamma/tau [Candidatus Omnitrophica bacterium]|nr:DNA polymerase III subunit gamma/tau [Candidatus Omnitrophota bacterium]
MSYLPFARKYRPQTFEDLIGQPHVTTTLTRALSQKRLAQAYLFTGQRGVGKTSAARILAKCLNCEGGPVPAPCNRCASCTQIAQGTSLDVIEIDGASNRGIDEIRSLRETVPFAPAGGSFRVYIIDEVHMLTPEAFNALLKTLEEPPAHVKFVFATTAAAKVPPTILSRCQRFDFRRLEAATVVKALSKVAKAERVRASEPALYAIARASEGSLRDAEVILEQLASFVEGTIEERDVTELLGAIESDALIAWTQAVLERDAPQALAQLSSQLEQGRDPLQLLTGLLRHLRNLLIIRAAAEAPSREALIARLVDEPLDRLKRLEEQANRSTPQELLLFLQMLTGAYELVRRSPMAQAILELAVVKLATREAWQSLDEISRRLEQAGAGALPAGGTAAAARPAPRSPSAMGDEPPAAMSAAPEAAPAELPDAVRSTWPTFLERLGAKKMSLAAYLAHARPLSVEGATLIVGLPGFALHQEVLSVAEHSRLIDRLLSELCGAALTVRYVTLAEPVDAGSASAQSEAEAAAPPIVQEIVNLFNATILDQPRPTP